MRVFQSLNVDWMGKRKFFYGLSTTIFVLGMLSILIRGLEFGIDFKGGTELELQADKTFEISALRNAVSNIGLGDLEVKSFGGDKNVLIRTELQTIPQDIFTKLQAAIEKDIDAVSPGVVKTVKEKTEASITYEFASPELANSVVEGIFAKGFQAGRVSEEVTNTQMIVRVGIADWIKESLRNKLPSYKFEVRRAEIIGPKVGKELKIDAVIAITLSLLGILVYLAFRYKFIFATGAVVALFHDVLITLGLFAIFYGVIPGLNLEMNLTVMAAFLTLIGYSINDTVIVFDRVRETIKLHKTEPLFNLMNMAVNKTMSRTVLTGGTTLLSCIVLLIFGGEVLRAFAFTLTFGIITGTYSSVFVASAIVLDYTEKTGKKVEF
ncbi:MAG: protein translocase subunit SecF [Ignavibacteriales bacterium]|nr:protein translocase subunit SecF [Ignavibacteriales bacterium]